MDVLVLAVTGPTIRSAIPPACLSLGGGELYLYPLSARKLRTFADLYDVSESIRMNLGFNLSGFLWSNTLHVGCRSHSRVKERTISSASRFFVKLQYIIWLAPSLIRSQYLYPRWDVWPQANASIRKHCPGTVGSGLCIRCLSVAVCLSSPYMHALHNGRTLAASPSENLAFLECSRCHLM